MNRLHFLRPLVPALAVFFVVPGSAFAFQDEKPTPASAPQQPGDDEAKPLPKESDDKKAAAMAAYMDGVAKQKEGKLSAAQDAFKKAAELDPTAAEPLRAHSLLLMRMGKTRPAVEMAKKAIELDKDDYETRLQLAVLMSQRNQAQEAIKLIEEAVQSKTLEPKSEDAINIHKARAALYRATQVPQKAAESFEVLLDALEEPEAYGLDFRKQVALQSDQLTGYEGIGKMMLQVGRYDSAVTAFEGMIKANDDTPGKAHLFLATALYRQDKIEAAQKNLDRYFESNQRSDESLQLLSDIYRVSGKTSELPERFDKLAENSSDGSTVRMFLGNYLIEQGEGEEAAKVFNAVITESGDAKARLGLVRIQVLNQEAPGVIAEISKCLKARVSLQELSGVGAEIANNNDFATEVVNQAVEAIGQKLSPEEYFFYSRIAENAEQSEAEGKLLQATIDANPPTGLGLEALNRLGFNQLLTDKYKESAATYTRLLSYPNLPNELKVVTLYRLSQAQAFGEDYPAALETLKRAMIRSPNNPELTYQLGWTELQADDFDKAELYLKKATELANGDPGLVGRSSILLGAIYTQQQKWPKAISTYEEMLEISGLSDELVRRGRTALSNAYVQKGDVPNGVRILEEVYAASPNDPGVNNDLGYLYADQDRDLEKAENMIRIAVKAEPENRAYLDSLGWVLYRLERFEEALKALEKANADPDYQDSTIIEHLGDVQKALGKNDDAEVTWKKALAAEEDATIANDETVERLKKKIAGDE